MLSLLYFKNQWMQLSLCCQGTFSKQWMDFYMLSLLFHLAVDMIFHKLPLFPFKEQWMLFSMCCHITFNRQWMISICCHCCFTKQWMWFSTCCHYPLSKKQIWFSVCFHSTLNKQWKVFHMLSLLCTKQCMGFSTCCHCSLSNINGCSFSCAFKAHSLSTGWISICYHCCSTKQWMRFSTCHYPLKKQQMMFHRVTVVN